MKKLFPILVVLAFVTGLSQAAWAEKVNPKNKEILSAFDVVTLMKKGSSDADIVKVLTEQRGIARDSAPIKGKSDEQALYYLLTYAKPKGKVPDRGKTLIHKDLGDKALRSGLFEKAATEYSLAIDFSENDYAPYKSRADSYSGYLKAKTDIAKNAGSEVKEPPLSGETRSLLCNNIYNDYHLASLLNNKEVQAGILEMDRLRDRMQELRDNPDPSVDYKRKSYENIMNMRLLQQIYYSQRNAYQAGVNIRKAQEQYNTLCADEEAARRDMVRLTRNTMRDKKWQKFGEKEDESYFYDTSNISKSKGISTVMFLKENIYDDKSYQLTKLTLDCKKKTFATQDYSGYDEYGNQVFHKTFKNSAMKSAAAGTAEALLLDAICK
ncbi:MAG: surface-adhesin E family protein [Geobacteraceae bacterium]